MIHNLPFTFNVCDALQWAGALTGIAGAMMLALNRPWSKWAWPIWTISNLCIIGFAISMSAWAISLMELVYLATSIIGIRQWFLRSAD